MERGRRSGGARLRMLAAVALLETVAGCDRASTGDPATPTLSKGVEAGGLDGDTVRSAQASPDPTRSLTLSCPDIAPGSAIPRRFTCQGAGLSPPLSWAGVPPGAQSLALTVLDPDAPDPAAPQLTWTHWLVFNLPPTASGLPEGVKELPQGALQGINGWGEARYGAVCPPIGRHRYFFRLYALDTTLPRSAGTSAAALLAAMQGHVLAESEFMGTYQK